MNTVSVIIKNTITIENGEAFVTHELLHHYGFYPESRTSAANSQIDVLNTDWGTEKALSMGAYGLSSEEHLDRFYEKYGVLPYDYISININNLGKS